MGTVQSGASAGNSIAGAVNVHPQPTREGFTRVFASAIIADNLPLDDDGRPPSIPERWLWLILDTHCGRKTFNWFGNFTLSEEVGCTERNINLLLGKLERRGIVHRVEPDGPKDGRVGIILRRRIDPDSPAADTHAALDLAVAQLREHREAYDATRRERRREGRRKARHPRGIDTASRKDFSPSSRKNFAPRRAQKISGELDLSLSFESDAPESDGPVADSAQRQRPGESGAPAGPLVSVLTKLLPPALATSAGEDAPPEPTPAESQPADRGGPDPSPPAPRMRPPDSTTAPPPSSPGAGDDPTEPASVREMWARVRDRSGGDGPRRRDLPESAGVRKLREGRLQLAAVAADNPELARVLARDVATPTAPSRPAPSPDAPTAEVLAALRWCDDPGIVVRASERLLRDFGDDQKLFQSFKELCYDAWTYRYSKSWMVDGLVHCHGKAMGPLVIRRGAVFKIEIDKWYNEHSSKL